MTPGKDVKVLVVDDNALILDLLMKGLMPHCDAQAAADGADALLKIVDDPPDLVVCDYRMPGLDVYKRQIFNSASAPSAAALASQCGIRAFISRSSISALLSLIHIFQRRRHQRLQFADWPRLRF